MKHLIIAAGVAILGTVSIHAAGVPTVDGDLAIGFRNSSTDVIINLGHFDTINASALAAPDRTYTFESIGSILSSSAFGATWSTVTGPSAVKWGVVVNYGTLDSLGTTIVSTRWVKAGTLGVQNTVPVITGGGVRTSDSGLDTATTGIGKVYNALRDVKSTDGRSMTISSSTNNSWTKGESSLVTSPSVFGDFSRASFEQTASNAFLTADLYQYQKGVDALYLGSIALSNTGDLTFTAVPEPSTYAMILGALTLGFVAVRRRLVKQA